MIIKTSNGLYTTTTRTFQAVERVNVFQTEKEALESLNKYERIQYKVDKIKVTIDHGLLLGFGIAYIKKELTIFLPFTVINIEM